MSKSKDIRVTAIRADRLVGRSSASSIQNCWEDGELSAALDAEGIATAEEAIAWARKREGLFLERGLNQRWGEDEDPQLSAYREWQEKLKEEENVSTKKSKSVIDAIEIGRVAAQLGIAAREWFACGWVLNEDACGAWARVREVASDELIAAACEALLVGRGPGVVTLVHDGEGAAGPGGALDFCAERLEDVLAPSQERLTELMDAWREMNAESAKAEREESAEA